MRKVLTMQLGKTLVMIVCVLSAGLLRAEDDGWEFYSQEPATNELGMQAFNDATGTTATTNETEATAEIVALARSLHNDPVLIYDYVRNHIEFGPPTYGLHNGAHGCLMAERGSDADQAALLSALLRVSGYTTRFAIGTATYLKSDVANWLGITEGMVVQFLANCGYPAVTASGNNFIVPRFWVEMQDGGTWRRLDSSFKEYGPTNGIDLASIMGYSQTQFIASAMQGATATTNYVQSMNATNIGALLTTYATNLLAYVRGPGAQGSINELIEGRVAIPLVTTSLPTNLPHALSVSLADTQDHFFTNLVATVRIQHQGIDVKFKSYAIAARRLSLTYNAGDSYKPQLWLDGALIATGTATTAGSSYTLTTTIDNPYNAAGYADKTLTKNLISGSTYVILCDFDGSSPRLVQKHNLALARNLQSGLSATSEPILAGGLHISSLAGLRQWQLSRQLMGRVANCTAVFHYFAGVFAQESGYYCDLPAGASVMSRTGSSTDESSWRIASSFVASALEHGVLEQMQGTSKPAVSTIKVLQLGNAAGKRTYLATSANWAAMVRPNLTNYSSLAQLDSFISSGYTLLVPEDGGIQLNQWKGVGYVAAKSPNGVVMMISGGLNGGYASAPGTFSSITAQNLCYNAYHAQPYEVRPTTSVDPVDLSSGDCLSANEDLTVGAGAPGSLTLARKYNSGRGFIKGVVGYGWAHNHDIRATTASLGDLAFGTRQPADGVAVLAQSFVTFDLLRGSSDIKQWTAAVLATKWGMDQAIANVAVVQLADRALEFAKSPDGTYLAPPGVTAALSFENGRFVLDERFGRRWVFNTNGTLSAWSDANSNTVRYAYSAYTNVTLVSNSFGRTLAFSYSGAGLLTNVADGCGRSVSYQYSASNLVAHVDPEGNSWAYAYDTNHWLVSIKDPLNRLVVSNSFNSLGQVDSQMNGAGNAWSFYVNRWRGAEEDPQGARTVYWFDASGRNVSTLDALSNATCRTFDSHGHLVTNTDARGHATVFQYDANHNITNRIDALTNRTSYAYDGAFHLVSVTDPLGNVTRFAYDSQHRMTNTVDALSNAVTFSYFSNGLVRAVVAGSRVVSNAYNNSGALTNMARTDGGAVNYLYNTWGDISTVVDANGHTNAFTYDKRRLLTSERDPLGYWTSNVYDSSGLRIKAIDPNGNTNQFVWTATRNVSMEIFPDGGTNAYGYDSVDRLRTLTDPLGRVTSNRFDKAGRKIAVVGPLGDETAFVLDANGEIVAQTNALGHVIHYSRDAEGRVTNTWDVLPGGLRSDTAIFDSAGRLIRTTDADGFTTEFQYDALNRKTAMVNSDGTTERFEYDAFGALTAYVNGNGHRTAMTYDGMGRRIAVTDPMSNRVSHVFDPVGNLIARTNADGAVVQYLYNAVNNRVRTVYPGGVTNHYTYDKNRLLTNVVDSLGWSRVAYDRMNRQTQVVSAVGAVTSTVSYAYDLRGNRIRTVYPGGLVVTNTFDGADRLSSVADWNGRMILQSYNAVHSPTGIVYPNGVTGSFVWDDASRLVGFSYATNGASFIKRAYTLDAVGNRVQEDVTAGLSPVLTPVVRRLTQDAANRLTGVLEKTYPDSAGWTTQVPTWDSNGNMLSDGAGLSLSYDPDNRVTNIQSAAVGSRGFEFDGFGGVVRRSVDEVPVIDVLDGTRPLMTRSTNGAALVYYIWGNGFVARIGTNGIALYAHADGQGNVLAMTATNGAVTDQWFYSPYGEILNRSGTTDTPFQWLGGHGVRHEGGGIYRTYYRMYHSGRMRFTSADPIGLAGGGNLFAYGNGNPLFYLDPWGLCGEPWYGRAWNAAWQGDFSGQNNGWAGVGSQTLVGAIPIVGQVADARDTAANIRNVWNNPNSGSAWGGLAAAGVAWVPVAGDAARGLFRAGRGVATDAGQAAVHSVSAITDSSRLLTGSENLAQHHVFPQQFRGWFSQQGVNNIDDFTVTVDQNVTHLRAIHGGGNMGQMPGAWNAEWSDFIQNNPNASPLQIYQQGGRMMDDFGIGNLPLHPYGSH